MYLRKINNYSPHKLKRPLPSPLGRAALAFAFACFSVPRMLLPTDIAKSDNKLLFDGVCNLCNGYILALMYATITQDSTT